MRHKNTEELVTIYKIIKARPQEWYQGEYAVCGLVAENVFRGKVLMGELTAEQEADYCGSAYCFAGHAAIRAGAVPAWGTYSETATECCTPDGRNMFIADYASEVLGLNDHESFELFSASNTLVQIRNHIIEFTGIDPEA